MQGEWLEISLYAEIRTVTFICVTLQQHWKLAQVSSARTWCAASAFHTSGHLRGEARESGWRFKQYEISSITRWLCGMSTAGSVDTLFNSHPGQRNHQDPLSSIDSHNIWFYSILLSVRAKKKSKKKICLLDAHKNILIAPTRGSSEWCLNFSIRNICTLCFNIWSHAGFYTGLQASTEIHWSLRKRTPMCNGFG